MALGGNLRQAGGMTKEEHGRLLAAAMKRHGLNRQAVADVANVKPRTVTNWTGGATMPSRREQEALRSSVLGNYDVQGDPVEVAVRGSELIDWRQDAVISTYKKNLHEQRSEAAS